MKSILAALIIFVFCITVFSQKLTEPQFLGAWIAGEDESEFLYHRVWETSLENLKENPNGELIVRICSLDDFLTAFVTAPLNPLTITHYNFYRQLTSQKVYIARSSNCLFEGKYNLNEYWFVPDRSMFEYQEIFPVDKIYYENFAIYEFEDDDYKTFSKEFDKNLTDFISKLKEHSESKGFIVHNSKNRKMKSNIKKVMSKVKKEGINTERIETIINTRLDVNESGKLLPVKDEGNSFPTLAVIEIKK